MRRPPPTSARFRRLAEECERLALEVDDPVTCQILLDLATRWRELAEEDEQDSR